MSLSETTADIIDNIYDSVGIDEQGWMPVLDVIVRKFDAGGVHIFLRNTATGEAIEDSRYGANHDVLEADFRRLLHTDPAWNSLIKNHGLTFKSDDNYPDVLSGSASVCYEVQKPIDCHYQITRVLQLDGDWIAGFIITRPKSVGTFSSQHIARLEYLLPHIMRAVRLAQKFRRVERAAAGLVAALDHLPTAALIVSDTLELICMNRQADELLDACESVNICRGELVPARASEANILRKAVRDALVLVDNDCHTPLTPSQVVRITRPQKLPLDVLVIPIRAGKNARHSARVILMLYDPESRPRIDPGLIERLFELTSTEAWIAVRLAEGHSIAEVAKERRCSTSTVRTHVKSIFQKTDTNRQSELVQLLLTSPAMSFLG